MFKSARWRGDKNKIKIEFKLQFSATQVSRSNADPLTVSVVPGDVGKPSLKSEKAPVRDGSCRWENPVYLLVKFDTDSKTGKINAKIYKFLVSTGLTKAIVLGEVSIDFSEYADAIKASNLSLPLKNSNSSAILHVCLQRLQMYANNRDIEECEDKISSFDPNMKAYLSKGDADESANTNRNDDESGNQSSESDKLNSNCRESSESDITLSSSESSSGLDTPHGVESQSNKFNPDPPGELVSSKNNEEHQKEEWDWSLNAISKERLKKENVEIEKLKRELAVLARQADVSEMELQTLRKHIVKESKKGQDLSREIVSLKEERDLLKLECKKLKAFQVRVNDANAKNKLQVDGGGDLQAILEEIRQELNYEKELNANLRVQLQKTQESNNELILAVQDLELLLEKKKGENIDKFVEREEDEEQKALENLVKEHINGNETYALEQKLMDLSGEIEIYRKDKDELEMQVEQLALDYEIMKQENHDLSCKLEQSHLEEQLKLQYEYPSSLATINELETHIESLENEIRQQSIDFADSLTTIKDLESRIIDLEEDLTKQTKGFEADIEALTIAKVEQEKQTIKAEEALRKTMWKNANTAERLQDEVRKLSMQMMCSFEANERVVLKALAEANDLRLQRGQLEELLKKANAENRSARDDYEAKICDISGQLECNKTRFEQMSEELETKTKQIECQTKQKEELCSYFSREIQNLKNEIESLRIENEKLVKQEEYASVHRGSKEVARLMERTKLLEKQIKSRENALQESTNSFLEKERDLHNKIDELASRIEELDHVTIVVKANGKTENTSDVIMPEQTRGRDEETTGDEISIKSKVTVSLERELSRYGSSNDRLTTELRVLNERNKIMESELKEMQERYSEISLKFAEVEGERQKLVMTLRYLKNSKKGL